MTKRMLQVEDMIKLENWLKENENKTVIISKLNEIFSKFSEEERKNITMAKKMPQKEIEDAI